MSLTLLRPGARRRALGLLSSAAVVAALAAAVPATAPAVAAPSGKPASALSATSTAVKDLSAGRYIVVLREPGAASYDGGNPRYGATRSTSGQFDARSARVQAYTAHLRQTQQRVAGDYGVDPVANVTVATNAFVADLSKKQALSLSSDRRVMLLDKSRNLHLDTWNTPAFLGLSGKDGAWTTHGGEKHAGAGVVVADLDTGIWPESRSFKGAALTAKPKTTWDISRSGTTTRMEKADGGVFRGECVIADGWDAGDCNTKIISARYYGDSFLSGVPVEELSEFEHVSARDGDGHGTHTASTAAGNRVRGVTTEGRKFGTVTGMAPAARIAVYKVCWEAADSDKSGCNNADVIQAVDQAVIDGVDVLNFSVGGGASPTLDATELAFEGAAEAGIFVAASAGNSGPGESTLDHPGPWLTTVAASTSYSYENTVVLGNGKKIVGASVSSTAVPSTKLVDSAASGLPDADPDAVALCGPDTLDPAKVSGTIVVCLRGVYDRVAKSAEVERAGGKAMILVNPSPNSLDADFHAVPTIHISDTDGPKVYDYLEEAGAKATASFKLGNLTKHVTPLPQVGGFSSRGPIIAAGGDLLKPDIAAPGVSVLAAVAPPPDSGRTYDLMSGTSMAAPHITGLAAFMQSVHPNWTPMQIKSAMMTTATPTKTADGKRSRDAFAQGAGQVTPKRFFNPGLFVTSGATQWRGFLTGLGFNTGVPTVDPKDVNVPSLADASVTAETTFHRTFRASMKGVWKISASVPGFSLDTNVKAVRADRVNDLQDVTFRFTRTTAPLGHYVTGWVTLTGPTTVKMPVALKPLSVDAPALVTGTGTSGSVDVPITAGFTGDLDVTPHGLAASDTKTGEVDPGGDYDLECVTVPEGSGLAKFQVDAADDTADLDLFVYASESCAPEDVFAQVGSSATASADEAVTLRDPEPGTYLVEIDGFSSGEAGAPMQYAFDFWSIDPTSTAGSLTVTPDPVPVTANKETTLSVSWSGLDAGVHYLGYLAYADSDSVTVLDIDAGE
ncbi:S8 family serine peptidase [Nocardioides sp.]|uniref:S8 family serine peptidase n=1 Tax=Nocardioides sp. TaxID=35761 RepID=UPI0025DCAA42|nr:S8 family serine peptidase [Nocardioides sp.]